MKAIVVMLVLVAGCATDLPAKSVNVVFTDNVEKPCGTPLIGTLLGCSRKTGDVCTIYAKRPRSEKDKQRFETLGHELMHCAEGQWHDQWGRMVKKGE